MTAEPGSNPGTSTPGQHRARSSITRTTITPAPGTIVPDAEPSAGQADTQRVPLRQRLQRAGQHGELTTAHQPYPGGRVLRVVITVGLSVLCLATTAGAALMLLLWRQQRSAGVLSTDIDRTWELFDHLRSIERWVAFVIVPVAVAWIALAAVNVKRATGQRRNPIVAALSLPVGLAGVWFAGAEIVAKSDDAVAKAGGVVLQCVMAAIPLLFLERIVEAAEARHRPLRATYLISAAYIAHLTGLGAISTTEVTTDPDKWSKLGAYLLIAALLQVLGTLAANEAARAIEDGTHHRYELRHRFGEALLAQAKRTR